MIWSEFLERMQEMEIQPGAEVLHIEYDFAMSSDDAVAVTYINDADLDSDESLPIRGIRG